MKKFIILLLGVMFFSVNLFSQNQDLGLLTPDGSNSRPASGHSLFAPDFDLTLGTSFSTGRGGLFSTQSISPRLSFEPGKNFSLVIGSFLSTSQLSQGGSLTGLSTQFSGGVPGRFMSATFYAMGSYNVNPRLTITGGGWVERNNLNSVSHQMQMNPQAFNINAGGMVMGMEYRISDNLRFGAQINVSRGHNPFQTHYNRGFYHNPAHFMFP